MFYIDDIPLTVGVAFTHNGESFPANWAQLFTAEDRARYNITEVPDPTPFNDKFYYAPNMPKDLDMLKIQLINEVKWFTSNCLSATSWMIERYNDPSSGKPVPQNVLDHRAALRALSNTYEDNINAATSVDELAVMHFTFPDPV